MTGRCGSCRHWSPVPPLGDEVDRGFCKVVVYNYGLGGALKDGRAKLSSEGGLLTTASFGCSLFEGKEGSSSEFKPGDRVLVYYAPNSADLQQYSEVVSTPQENDSRVKFLGIFEEKMTSIEFHRARVVDRQEDLVVYGGDHHEEDLILVIDADEKKCGLSARGRTFRKVGSVPHLYLEGPYPDGYQANAVVVMEGSK